MLPTSTDLDVRRAYSADVSGLVLVPDVVARPTTEDEVIDLIRRAELERTPVTTAGGQTSTTGASIVDRGILLSMKGLNRIVDVDRRQQRAIVQPGVLLADLNHVLATEGLFFAPDPTSLETVTVGGAIACNASGARSFKYGPTRQHVSGLHVLLANGDYLRLRRSGLEKNTVGYLMTQEPVDWFVGSEGTLGVIMQAELSLRELPSETVGLAIECSSESDALNLVVDLRESDRIKPRCLEYFDAEAVIIAREVAGAPWHCNAIVYTEYERCDHNDLELWSETIDRSRGVESVTVLQGEQALRDARRYRHAIPATMNERGARCRNDGGRKVSTDWAVPYRELANAITAARQVAEAARIIPPVIYGHAGNGHPHQNFIARDASELAHIEGVVEETLRNVLRLGGTVAAEHGIGKVKRRWVPMQASPVQVGVLRAIKRELDPHGLMAPGNILEP